MSKIVKCSAIPALIANGINLKPRCQLINLSLLLKIKKSNKDKHAIFFPSTLQFPKVLHIGFLWTASNDAKGITDTAKKVTF